MITRNRKGSAQVVHQDDADDYRTLHATGAELERSYTQGGIHAEPEMGQRKKPHLAYSMCRTAAPQLSQPPIRLAFSFFLYLFYWHPS